MKVLKNPLFLPFIFNLLVWVLWFWKIKGLYFLPSASLFIVLINSFFYFLFLTKDKRLSYFWLGSAVFVQILSLIFGIFI